MQCSGCVPSRQLLKQAAQPRAFSFGVGGDVTLCAV